MASKNFVFPDFETTTKLEDTKNLRKQSKKTRFESSNYSDTALSDKSGKNKIHKVYL